MMLKRLHLPFAILFLLFASLCLANSKIIWNKPSKWNAGLPNSIQVFQTNSSFASGILTTAAYCLFDLSDSDLELKVVSSPDGTAKTPLEFAQEETHHVYMVSNGGFFDTTHLVTVGLVISEGKFIGTDSGKKIQLYNGKNVTYYPMRGAFGVDANGKADIGWTYSLLHVKSDVWFYPEPSPNCFKCPPQKMPTINFPKGGKAWKVSNAVGGWPVLVKDGAVNVTSEQELTDPALVQTRNPRTAVCITKDKKIVVMAVDGRYTLSSGVLLSELAEVLQELGCEEALNLDGGGSTALIVNGFLTNRPSDAAGMRHVTSAVMLVSKTKLKEDHKQVLEI